MFVYIIVRSLESRERNGYSGRGTGCNVLGVELTSSLRVVIPSFTSLKLRPSYRDNIDKVLTLPLLKRHTRISYKRILRFSEDSSTLITLMVRGESLIHPYPDTGMLPYIFIIYISPTTPGRDVVTMTRHPEITTTFHLGI